MRSLVTTDRIRVSVPARAEVLHVLRAVTGSVAARHGFTVDDIQDLRIAVDEACAHLLGLGLPEVQLCLSLSWDDQGLWLEASITEPVEHWPPAHHERTLTWQVLTGLTDEAGSSVTGRVSRWCGSGSGGNRYDDRRGGPAGGGGRGGRR